MNQIQYTAFTTQDGSPTLQTTGSTWSEKMHHANGAFSETVLIYEPAVLRALDSSWPPVGLVVGLGMGYLELLFAALCLKRDLAPAQIALESFESEAFLRQEFLQWLSGEKRDGDELHKAYDVILKMTADRHGLSPDQVRTYLKPSTNWNLRDTLTPELVLQPRPNEQRFTSILFDAFSKAASPELWSEEFLVAMLKNWASEHCVFVSYAATGNLKRALKSQGFDLIFTPGFSGKRESTVAVRGMKEK